MLDIKDFFHKETATLTYIVTDVATGQCAIIDPVLDFDLASGCVTTTAADDLLAYVKKNDLTVQWLLETHIHADHLTAAQYLKEKTNAPIASI